MPFRTMSIAAALCVFSAAGTAQDFLLGSGYTQWLTPNVTQIATDKTGAIYALTSFPISGNTPPSTVTKLAPDGRTLIWQNKLDIAASAMAVDPEGGVYVAPVALSGAYSVAKLDSGGAGIAWTRSTGIDVTFGFLPVLAADSSGRAYVAAFTNGATRSVRLSPSGDAIEYSLTFSGMPTAIALDAAGSAFVTGYSDLGVFLTRIARDGSLAFHTSAPHPSVAPSVAIGADGAVVYSGGVLKRFDAAGSLLSSKHVVTWQRSYPGVALDAQGNVYIAGSSANVASHVKNSLAVCESEMLSVIAPDDTVLQTTYLAGASGNGVRIPLAVTRGSLVLLALSAAPSFAPSRTGPLPATDGAMFLMQLSPNAEGRPLPLVCAGNAFSFATGSIAPGEIVALLGSGLGPAEGVSATATENSPFPKRLANVEVTVNGTPAPLLWVQERQVNLIVPWDVAVGSLAEVCLEYNGSRTNCLSVPATITAAAAATFDGVFAVAINEDGTLNSAGNRAPAGSIVTVWATGLGPLSTPQADGSIVLPPLPFNTLPLSIEFSTPGFFPIGGGSQSFPEILYAGPAPFAVSGLTQINFRAEGRGGSYFLKIGPDRSPPFQIY